MKKKDSFPFSNCPRNAFPGALPSFTLDPQEPPDLTQPSPWATKSSDHKRLYLGKINNATSSQPVFTCLKLTIETPEQGAKYAQS